MRSYLAASQYILQFSPLEKVMAPQSLAMPADIRVLHTNIVEKMKFSKGFETLFFGLKRCLAASLTCFCKDKAIFREKIM